MVNYSKSHLPLLLRPFRVVTNQDETNSGRRSTTIKRNPDTTLHHNVARAGCSPSGTRCKRVPALFQIHYDPYRWPGTLFFRYTYPGIHSASIRVHIKERSRELVVVVVGMDLVAMARRSSCILCFVFALSSPPGDNSFAWFPVMYKTCRVS